MKSISETCVRPRRLGLWAYLSCIRYPDVLVLQGSPLLGVAFAIGDLTVEKARAVTVFAAASFLLVAHIWSFNDWAGLTADLNDPNKSEHVFSTRGVSSRGLLLFSLGLLVASLALFAFAPHRTLLIAVTIAALGILYSHPALNAKSVPILCSLPHLLGGLFHFLLGYSLFDPLDRRGVLIGFFFALTFTAGHLNQEVRDYEGDRVNGLRTNAVFFGKGRTFLVGLVLFTLAYTNLAWLAYRGLIPATLGILPLGLYPIHLVLSVRALQRGLSFDSVAQLQRGYRMLYAVIGLGMVTVLVLR